MNRIEYIITILLLVALAVIVIPHFYFYGAAVCLTAIPRSPKIEKAPYGEEVEIV
jgi:hypothetical protein